MITPASSLCNKLARITSALFLNATQVAAMKADLSAILTIDKDIAEYHQELKLIINLQKAVKVIHTNNTNYTWHIVSLKDNLKTANKTIRILQGLMITAPTLWAMELPNPPEYSGDRKVLPNFISKVYSKLAGERRHFSTINTNFATFIVTLRIMPRTKFNHTSKPTTFPWITSKP
jgi:hypothetical protein